MVRNVLKYMTVFQSSVKDTKYHGDGDYGKPAQPVQHSVLLHVETFEMRKLLPTPNPGKAEIEQ
jgi:hypothetical protein